MAATKKAAKKPRTARQKTVKANWPRIDYLVDALAYYEARADAYAASCPSAAVKAKDAARKVRDEIDQLRETERRVDLPPDPATHRAELLHELRRMRIGATASGSYTAAEKLIASESTHLASMEQERREREADSLRSISDADIEDEVQIILETLPPETLRKLRDVLLDNDES